MGLVKYFWRWPTTAFRHAFGMPDAIAGFLGMVLPPVLHFVPANERTAVGDLGWQVPLGLLAGIAIIRLLLAPYWMQKEDMASLATARGERDALKKQLEDVVAIGTQVQAQVDVTDTKAEMVPLDIASVMVTSASHVLRVTVWYDVVASLPIEMTVAQLRLGDHAKFVANEPINDWTFLGVTHGLVSSFDLPFDFANGNWLARLLVIGPKGQWAPEEEFVLPSPYASRG